jgi:outer membrane lipoprotein-sorting protein
MRRLTFITAAAVLLSLSLSAQTVEEVIAKNIAAQGGMARLKAIQSMRMTGDVVSGGMQAGFTQVFKRPVKMRLDISVQDLTLTQAYDGQNGWQLVPFTGKKSPEPMSADDLKQVQQSADFDGPLMDYKQKGNNIELAGKEKIEGTNAYHLIVTLKNGNIENMYLDADTFLEFKSVARTTNRGTAIDLETTVGDYKEVEGVMFPFSIEQHPVGSQGPGQKITVKKIELNVPLEDSIFKMPAVAPPPAQEKTGSSPVPNGRQFKKPD